MAMAYSALGGTSDPSSPVVIKGGAAAWLYLFATASPLWFNERWRAEVPTAAADIDFAYMKPITSAVDRVASRLLPRLAIFVKKTGLVQRIQNRWPLWRVRDDASLGESFCCDSRAPIGHSALSHLPVKLTCHRQGNQVDEKDLSLLRVGVALYHKKLQRSTVISFVDIAVQPVSTDTVMIAGMRLQSPSQMLRDLRRLIFHETTYRPWENRLIDVEKHARRMDRIVKLSVALDVRRVLVEEVAIERWKRLPRRLLYSVEAEEPDQLRQMAVDAPRQIRFFLKVVARTLEEAIRAKDNGGPEEVREFHCWIRDVLTFSIIGMLR